MKLARLIVALAAPLLLSGCFLVPGLFTSNLDLRKDGSFTFAYKGQIVIAAPDDVMGDKPKIWSESMAKCFTSGRTYLDEFSGPDAFAGPEDAAKDVVETRAEPVADASAGTMTAGEDDEKPRACKPAEIAALKKEFDDGQAAKAERKKKESAEFAAIFGLGASDDEANQKIAANLMKYEGWKSVVYKGKGVYDVDYQLTGKIGYDYVFPIFPQGDIMIPFVTVRKRSDGSVFVSAPALAGGGFKAFAARAKMLGAGGAKDMPQTSVVTKGRFTVTTNGNVLTNNTNEGPSAGPTGQTLAWDIDSNSEKIPEALIKLQ